MLLRVASAWRHTGTPPVAGGYFDQPAVLTRDCEQVWSEQAEMRDRMSPGGGTSDDDG